MLNCQQVFALIFYGILDLWGILSTSVDKLPQRSLFSTSVDKLPQRSLFALKKRTTGGPFLSFISLQQSHASSPAHISVGLPPSFMPTATSTARTTTWIAIAGIVPSTPKAVL